MSTDAKPPARLPLFLTDADVEALSDLPSAIAAIRAAYGAPVDDRRNPGRIFADSTREWMRVMPSVPRSGRLFGAKSINGSFADGLSRQLSDLAVRQGDRRAGRARRRQSSHGSAHGGDDCGRR